MIDLQATYAAPALHKTEKNHPNDVLVRLIDENPGASRDVIEKLVIAEIDDDPDYRRVTEKYWFWHAWNALQPRSRRKKPSARQKLQVNHVQATAENLQRLKRAVISELLMPNDKTVAQCTGLEMTKFGKFGARVGKICGRRKVGAVLTEKELWKLWQETR